ncbi:MAG TPA: AMP-binding protein [Acidimicrobiales bacterium]|nr:AMP-binding protein [Acidimicrobiales bacterium]
MRDLAKYLEAYPTGMAVAVVAAEEPGRPAVISPHGDRSFGELNTRANQLARALRAGGLGEGDGVALLCSNRPEFAEVYAATHRSGLRLTCINWHLTPEEAGYIAADCEAKALVADARLADLALGTAARAPGSAVRLAIGGEIAGFASYDEVLGREEGADLTDPVLGATMLYTSGTTGRPKGVYRSRTASATIRTIPVYGYRPGQDVHLCTGPLYHAAPLAFSLAVPLLCGVTVVLMDTWDAEETLRLVERHRVTHTHLVPTMFHRLLSLPPEVRSRYDLSSLRFVVHGAAPCPVPVKQALMEWMGPIVYEYYAATEGTGSWVDPQTWLAHPGTVGRPVDRDGLRVCDAGGEPLPAGEIGLVFLKAPEVGRFEYFKDSHKTAEAYRGDYFTLGDMGYKDDDGFLYLTDRSANLIISGGVNIYPAEVDAVLLTHPAVGDAATIGVPHPEWGEEVKAVVEVQPGVAPGDELAVELIEHCRARLAHFKCPRSVDFVDELPRQDNGKIYKRLLRDRYRVAMSGAGEQ